MHTVASLTRVPIALLLRSELQLPEYLPDEADAHAAVAKLGGEIISAEPEEPAAEEPAAEESPPEEPAAEEPQETQEGEEQQ